MKNKKALLLALALILCSAGALYLYHSRVRNSLTTDDLAALGKASSRFHLSALPPDAPYLDQVLQIAKAQQVVLMLAPGNRGIAPDSPREPADLFRAGSGLCYDRSRSMEKLLRFLGYETRHVSIYAAPENGWVCKGLLLAGTPSHAVFEVLTKKGWLLVDSNARWMALTVSGDPVSAGAMAADADKHAIAWLDPGGMNAIFRHPFCHVYGLYSRHGKFYPPYNPVPDINWGELVENL